MNQTVTKYLASIGARGGSAKTDAKAAAARENGKRGGRPRKDKLCPQTVPLTEPEQK